MFWLKIGQNTIVFEAHLYLILMPTLWFHSWPPEISVVGGPYCVFIVNRKFEDVCVSFDLRNLINAPTRHTRCYGSLIDRCRCLEDTLFQKVLNFSWWLINYHSIVCTTTNCDCRNRSTNFTTYHNFKNINDDALVYTLFHLSKAMVNCDRGINWCMQYVNTTCMESSIRMPR